MHSIRMSSRIIAATLYMLLVITVAAQDSCTLDTSYKDEGSPCRKLLHCREPRSWDSLSAELRTRSRSTDSICAIVVDCANSVTIVNFDFDSIGGVFNRVLNITISRCNTSQVRMADTMYSLVEVDLNGNAFTSLDIMHDWPNTEFEVIHFYRNRITSVRKSDFREFYMLSVVRLDSNLIEDVELGSFQNKLLLKIVNLANNRIASLKHGMFSGLPELKIVQLASNRISRMDYGVFISINLDLLDLSHNDIKAVPNSVFTNTSVISLNLSNCQFSIIPSGFVSSLKGSLTTLDLSNNGILQIACDALADLSHLKIIHLTGSRLTIIEQLMFPPSISEIHTTSDTLNCCRLLWLQKLIAGTNFSDEVECAYPFPAQLARYKYPGYNCAQPEVFPITTVDVNTTTMQATCVAKGVPAPNVTLMTEDGVHVSETVSISLVTFNLTTTARLSLPRTNVRGYELLCIAVNAEGMHNASVVVPPVATEKTSKSTPSLTPSTTITTTTPTAKASTTSSSPPPAITTTTPRSTTPSPTTSSTTTTTKTSTPSSTSPPTVTTTTTATTTTTTTPSTTLSPKTTTSSTTTVTTPLATTPSTPPPTITTTTSKNAPMSSTNPTKADVSGGQVSSVKTTQMVSTKSVEVTVTTDESESYVKWIIVASVVAAIVVIIIIVALVVRRRRRLTNRNRDSVLCFENLDFNQNDSSSATGDNAYCVIPADTDAFDNPIHFIANSANADVDYATIGAAGGRADSQVDGKVQDEAPTYMTLNHVGGHGGSEEHGYDRLDIATASKPATTRKPSTSCSKGKVHMCAKRPRTRKR